MSTTLSHALPFGRFGDGFGRAAAALVARVRHARQVAETRRYLEQMDDHMLSDLGVSRAQAAFELDHPTQQPRGF